MVFNYLAKSIRMNPMLEPLCRITDSGKRVTGLAVNAEYKALSADATTAHGMSPAMTVHDELGQVRGPVDALYDALETSGGAQLEALSHIISTQAASDGDLLSTLIDDMLRNPTPENVLRLYAAPVGSNIFDPDIWKQCNFALGIFRSEKEFREAAERAKRMPSFEATFRNLYLNQRVSLLQLLIAPSVWKDNAAVVDDALFESGEPVHIGADLSSARDLTAVVLSAKDPNTGVVNVKPYVFTPLQGLAERAQIDRAPYEMWAKKGQLVALPGKTISYEMIAQYMAPITKGMNLKTMNFDRWRIPAFRKACADVGWLEEIGEDNWKAVGQGFRDMSPRIEAFETLLLNERIAHGSHPLLNMAASNAVTVRDPANNRKLDKAKTSARIDPLVAAIMSVYAHVEEEGKSNIVDDRSVFFI
jgi:phage terminase large subunit-like protein